MTLNSERGAPSLGHLEKAGDGRWRGGLEKEGK